MIRGQYAPGFASGPLELPVDGGVLRLRRPAETDLDAVVSIHSDPDTNRHNPDGPMRDMEQGRVLLESWLVDWRERGIGYWTVEASGSAVPRAGAARVDPAPVRDAGRGNGAGRAKSNGHLPRARRNTAEPAAPEGDVAARHPRDWHIVGFSGVRNLPAGIGQVFNLYYRYAPVAWGRGWATRVALTACEAAREHDPESPVIARMQPDHLASQQVARKAGLCQVGYDLTGCPVLADREVPPSFIDSLPLF